MSAKDELLSKATLIEQSLDSVREIIKNNVAGIRQRLANALAGLGSPVAPSSDPATEDLSDVFTRLDAIHAAVSGLPVTTGVVETPPAPPAE